VFYLRLIITPAQDPIGAKRRSVTYTSHFSPYLFLGIFATFVIGTSIFASTDASTLRRENLSDANSQTLNVLSPNYSIATPGENLSVYANSINTKLALLSPQMGIGDNVIGARRTPESDPLGIIEYTVQEGDTLSEIAELFDVSVNTIKWENDLGNAIKPGQDIRILPVTGIRHTIEKGDTLSGISKLYDVEEDDIAVFNDIDDSKLVVGKKLIIPNGVKQEREVSIKNIIKGSKKNNVSSKGSGNGYYVRPTSGPITSLFGPRKGSYHYGIDFGAPTGTAIVAAADGRVVKTSCGSGYGKCLLIEHSNGTQSLYAHASKLYVGVGERVEQGETIAAVGSTGRSTGPHLHFEIIESNGKKRNVNFFK
jgi:murein DD-endopeptidase MepM/ murein hydrolase activator NlpD